MMSASKVCIYHIGVPVTPYIQSESQEFEDAMDVEKQMKAIKKSQFLKEYIKEGRCGFISEDLLRKDPIHAFQVAANSVKFDSLFNVKIKVINSKMRKKIFNHLNAQKAILNSSHTVILLMFLAMLTYNPGMIQGMR